MSKGSIATGTVLWAAGIALTAMGALIGAVYDTTQASISGLETKVNTTVTQVASDQSKNDAHWEEVVRRLDSIDKKLGN